MSMQSRLLRRAIQLADAGNPQDARPLLETVLRHDPHHETAWFEYVRTLETTGERIEALKRFLRVEPGNRRAQEVLWMLWEQKAGAAPVVAPGPPRSYFPFYVALSLLLVTLVVLAVEVLYLRPRVVSQWEGLYNQALAQYNGLRQEHDRLILEHYALQGEYRDLRQRHEALQAEHKDLSDQHSRLQQEYDGLADQHSQLLQEYDGLVAEHTLLLDQYSQLQQEYGTMSHEFTLFRSEAIAPPYICTSGRTVNIAFRRTDQTVDLWEVPFDSLEQSINRGVRNRESWLFEAASTLTLNNPNVEETYTVWDYRQFVDPGPFAAVMSDLYFELGDDDAFVREAWNIVAQLTAYSGEIEETPRYPLETFLAGGGDCEDTAILLASMILAAPVAWQVDLVYMDSDNPLDPRDVNHVMVFVDTGVEQYLIETTSDYWMEPYDRVVGWYLEVG